MTWPLRRRVPRERTPAELQALAERKRLDNLRLFAVHVVGPDGRRRDPQVSVSPAVLTIRLPYATPSLNDLVGHHPARKSRVRHAWASRLAYAIDLAAPARAWVPHLFPTLASRVDWVCPTNRPAVQVLRLVPSRRNFFDRDNKWGGCKPLIDALVAGDFLPNDREDDIDQRVDQNVSRDGLDWTVINIDARPLEARTPLEAC